MKIVIRLRKPHRHTPEFFARKLPRPEGGTYYQLVCTRKGCTKTFGPKRFKPQQIVAPSVLYSVKVRAEHMDTLLYVASLRDEAPVDYLNRLVHRSLQIIADSKAAMTENSST